MLFSAYSSILPAASWPPAGKAGGCSDERGSIQKRKKRRSLPKGILRLFASAAQRERPPRNYFLSF
jgi:hypothetical protein